MESDESSKKLEMPELQSILDDPGGSQFLENYLKDTGNFAYLEFIWACKGMKALISNDKEGNKQLVSCIYRQFILNGKLSNAISNKTFLNIVQTISQNLGVIAINSGISTCIFDQAEEEVQEYFKFVIYPNYHKYLRSLKEPRKRLTYFKEKQKPLKRELESSSTIILNDDGLPNSIALNRSLSYDLKEIKRPPTDPHIFAKELYKKLEILQNNLSVNRIPKNIQCAECQKEEIQAQEAFTIKLTKAIEEKLCSSVDPKTLPADTDVDMAFYKDRNKEEHPCCETDETFCSKSTLKSDFIKENPQNYSVSITKSFFNKLYNQKEKCSNVFKTNLLLCKSSEKTSSHSDTRCLISAKGSIA